MITLTHPFRPQGHRLLQGRRDLVAQPESGTEGQRCEDWKPAPSEGHRKVSSLVWVLGWTLWVPGSVSWGCG